MQKLLELRQKISSVQNIETITRTLATVSAAKLSWSRRRASGMREYTRTMEDVLQEQQAYLERKGVPLFSLSPLLFRRDQVRRAAVLVITADRGMCGSYNLAACRMALDFWEARKKAGQDILFLTKGRKGELFFRKRKAAIIHAAGWRRKGIQPDEVEKNLSLLVDLFLNGTVDEAYAVYTRFYSPIRRLPQIKRLLPIALERHGNRQAAVEKWYYEPTFRDIFDELLAIYLRTQLYDVLLESYASEQGARMLTMEEATERAEKTLSEYRMLYNRLRRESITIDLLGILFASSVAEGVTSTPGEIA